MNFIVKSQISKHLDIWFRNYSHSKIFCFYGKRLKNLKM